MINKIRQQSVWVESVLPFWKASAEARPPLVDLKRRQAPLSTEVKEEPHQTNEQLKTILGVSPVASASLAAMRASPKRNETEMDTTETSQGNKGTRVSISSARSQRQRKEDIWKKDTPQLVAQQSSPRDSRDSSRKSAKAS